MYMRFHTVDHIVDIYVKNLLYILCIYIYRYNTFLTYTFSIGCTSIYIVCGVLPQSRRFSHSERETGIQALDTRAMLLTVHLNTVFRKHVANSHF